MTPTQNLQTRIDAAMAAIRAELERAMKKHPEEWHSIHEGESHIREEFEELWDEIKKSDGRTANELMRTEATHLGATAVRFLVELCLPGRCKDLGEWISEPIIGLGEK